MAVCPDTGDLDRFIKDELDGAARTRIAAHLASCASCGETLDSLTDDTETARWRELFAAPGEAGELAFLARLASAPPEVTAKTTPVAPTPWPSLPGYQILEVLGSGGMGAVYLAHHEKLGRNVAIKVLRADLAKDANAVKRFRTSVQLLAKLDPHPHLAWAMHAGEHEGTHFLVMEYVAGENLKDVVQRQGPLAVDQACAFIRQAALGLEHAHTSRIIHRDVKPANLVLAPDGNIKVIDLGLARQQPTSAPPESPSSLTEVGAVLGTLDYLAPEQARDARSADARSDLYGLGCTFYFLLTGKPPFAERKPLENVVAHALEDPVPIQTHRPDVPAPVAETVHKLLAKKPEDRYPSARALVDALDALNRPASPVPSAHARRPPWRGVMATVVLLGLVPLAYLFGPQIIRIATNKGELVIETDDPAIEVVVKQGGATIIDPTTKRRIDLKVGDYDIELSEAKEGLQLSTKKFTLTRGGRAVVAVLFKPGEVKPPKTPDPAPGSAPGWKPIPLGESPLDKLDPKAIPESERFPWQPLELVAVIGEHRQRMFDTPFSLSVRPSEMQVVAGTSHGGSSIFAIPSGKHIWHDPRNGIYFRPDDKTMVGAHRAWYVGGVSPAIIANFDAPIGELCAQSADGTLAVRWHRDWDHVRLLDCSEIKKLRELARIPGAREAAISPDGRFIAVRLDSKSPVRIVEWDGKQIRPYHEMQPTTQGDHNLRPPFAFCADSKFGICTSKGFFELWDVTVKPPKRITDVPLSKGLKYMPVFSAKGDRVATGSQFLVRFFRIQDEMLALESEVVPDRDFRFERGNVSSIAFLKNGERAVTGHHNGSVRFWDTRERIAKEINPLRPNFTSAFEFSPDGARLIGWEEDNRLIRYLFGGDSPQRKPFTTNLSNEGPNHPRSSNASVFRRIWNNEHKLFKIDEEPAEIWASASERAVSVSPDGRLALVANDKAGEIALWNLTEKRGPATDWVKASLADASFVISLGGRHVAGFSKGVITIWVHADKKLSKVDEVKAPDEFVEMSFTPDGKNLAVFTQAHRLVRLEVRDDDVTSMQPSSIQSGSAGGSFSPDGKLLAIGRQTGEVLVYEYPGGKKRHEWKLPGTIQRVLFAPDCRHLLIHGHNGVIYILRLDPPVIVPSVEEAWRKMVGGLTPELQVKAVTSKLKDLNPGFEGKLMHEEDKGVVIGLTIHSDFVKDISPLRALPGLKFFSCEGSDLGGGILADLSPLQGMKLQGIHCSNTEVADVSPLKGMPLQYLNLSGTKVQDLGPVRRIKIYSLDLSRTPLEDLTPLEGANIELLNIGHTRVSNLGPLKNVPVKTLTCSNTPVTSLAPLKGMKLHGLMIADTRVSDLSPLAGMPLGMFNCRNTPVESLAPLKGMPLSKLYISNTRVTDLSPLDGMKLTNLECLKTSVKDLSPLRGMRLTHLNCDYTLVVDLEPLRGMKLEGLWCYGTGISDLSPLQGMPLGSLVCSQTKITSLAPVKGMPLTHLNCDGTKVKDLSALEGMKLTSLHFATTSVTDITVLKGMPITYLTFGDTKVQDLSPLKGMPLREIQCPFRPDRDEAILRSIKTLEIINGKPAAEFWKGIGTPPRK